MSAARKNRRPDADTPDHAATHPVPLILQERTLCATALRDAYKSIAHKVRSYTMRSLAEAVVDGRGREMVTGPPLIMRSAHRPRL